PSIMFIKKVDDPLLGIELFIRMNQNGFSQMNTRCIGVINRPCIFILSQFLPGLFQTFIGFINQYQCQIDNHTSTFSYTNSFNVLFFTSPVLKPLILKVRSIRQWFQKLIKVILLLS